MALRMSNGYHHYGYSALAAVPTVGDKVFQPGYPERAGVIVDYLGPDPAKHLRRDWFNTATVEIHWVHKKKRSWHHIYNLCLFEPMKKDLEEMTGSVTTTFFQLEQIKKDLWKKNSTPTSLAGTSTTDTAPG